MESALTYLGCSVLALVLLTTLYIVEDIKGHRILLVRARSLLDTVCNSVARKLSVSGVLFGKGFVRLLFHYIAHTVLKRFLLVLRAVEQKVEALVWRNKRLVKNIHTKKTGKSERSHLDEIADHKTEVALSSKQKEEMRSH